MTTRSIAMINRRIMDGSVRVMSADEFCNFVREEGRDAITFDDIDVVTCGTRGIMSGTMAILSFPVSRPDTFVRAIDVRLNGIPAFPGPCPNERLGVLDLVVYGTAHNGDYGGGDLFRDLVDGHSITVEITSSDGKQIDTTIRLDEIPFARMVGVRNAFKNYMAFVNTTECEVSSIFSTLPLKGSLKELTFSGCGEINPLENDPHLDTIGVGTRILMNGAEGFVEGVGTRSTWEKPNLSGFADMHDMNPIYMGGFKTSAGPEVINSWAIPIPVLNEQILENLKKLNHEIPLKVVDVHGRIPIGEITYADVWNQDLSTTFDPDACIDCEKCPVDEFCPTHAFSIALKQIDRNRCFNCGSCSLICTAGAFSGDNGSVRIGSRDIPIVCRQSDLCGGVKIAKELKKRIMDGSFLLNEPVPFR